MKVHEDDSGADVRTVLTAMIYSDAALGRVAAVWPREGEFAARWANSLGSLCVRHFREFGHAPGQLIFDLVASWGDGRGDKETVKLAERFLSDALNADSDAVNPDYAVHVAEAVFNKARLLRVKTNIELAYETGRPERALETVREFVPVRLGPDADIDLLSDREYVLEALEDQAETLIHYPGDAGLFFGRSLCRGNLIAVIAAEKVGKTFTLIDMAWRAMLERRRVAFLEVGDMSRPEIVRRFLARACGRPVYPTKYKYPTKLSVSRAYEWSVGFEEREARDKLTVAEVDRSFGDVVRRYVRSDDGYMRLRVSPAGTVPVARIRQTIDEWCQSGWVPDVVVIDYADILEMEGRDDFRHRTNKTWQELRALSMCPCAPLVLTATQANREAYDASVLKMKHTGEDKRKLAHVNGMIGIAPDPLAKAVDGVRVNWIVRREERANSGRPLCVARCLDEAVFFAQACFPDSAPPGAGPEYSV